MMILVDLEYIMLQLYKIMMILIDIECIIL